MINRINFFAIAIALLLFNCKGKDGAPGPEGTAPAISIQNLLTKEGSMKATMSVISDGKPASFNFDFQGYFPGSQSTYTTVNDTLTEISIFKSYANDGEGYISGNMSLSFDVNNLTSLKNLKFTYFSIDATKQLATRKLLDISARADMGNSLASESVPVIITDLKYNASTGIISGKFSGFAYTQSNFGGGNNDATKNPITNGTFSTVLYQATKNQRKSH